MHVDLHDTQRIRLIERFVVDCLRPALYLWPWIIAAMIYAAFLGSEQGEVLAWEILDKPNAELMIVTVIFLTGIVLFASSLLALVVPIPRNSDTRVRFRITVAGFWIIALCSSFGIILASATDAFAAQAASACVAVSTGAFLVWTLHTCDQPASSCRRLLAFFYRHRLILALVTAFVAIAPLVAGGTIVTRNPMWLTRFSPLLVSMLGLVLAATLFGAGLIIIPLCLQVWWLGLFVFGSLLSWSTSLPLVVDEENPLLKDDRAGLLDVKQAGPACQPPPGELDTALRRHFDRINNARQAMSGLGTGMPILPPPGDNFDHRKLYLVTAEGGGIRAAYWTALILGQMDIATGGEFHNRVATVSAVSGGSLGVATWIAAQERQDLTPEARLDLMKRFLQSDFLSPLVAGFLFLDVPRVLLGQLWFSSRRDHVFEKALADTWMDIGQTDFFRRTYLGLCLRGFKQAPAVFLNATEASSGSYVPLSSTALPPPRQPDHSEALSVDRGLARTSLKRAPVAQMVHISARFPFIAPEAEVGIEAAQLAAEMQANAQMPRNDLMRSGSATDNHAAPSRGERMFARAGILVDGGYYDNTAMTPTREALNRIAGWRKDEAEGIQRNIVHTRQARIEVLHIANNPGTSCRPMSDSSKERMAPRLQEFARAARLEVKCDQDRIRLEKSLRNNPTQWLMTPLTATLSVREKYSGAAASRLKEFIESIGLNAPVTEFSVGEEFKDAYNIAEQTASFRRAGKYLLQMRATQAKKQEAMTREAVGRLLEAKRVDASTAREFLKNLDDWAARMRAEGDQMRCPEKLEPLAPPLGWTLARQNQSLLQCLADRAAIKQDLGLPAPDLARLYPTSD